MSKKNMCPACRKQHDKMPPICMCGQHLTRDDTGGCPFVKEDGSICDENATRSYKTKAGDWYCPDHADEILKQSYIR